MSETAPNPLAGAGDAPTAAPQTAPQAPAAPPPAASDGYDNAMSTAAQSQLEELDKPLLTDPASPLKPPAIPPAQDGQAAANKPAPPPQKPDARPQIELGEGQKLTYRHGDKTYELTQEQLAAAAQASEGEAAVQQGGKAPADDQQWSKTMQAYNDDLRASGVAEAMNKLDGIDAEIARQESVVRSAHASNAQWAEAAQNPAALENDPNFNTKFNAAQGKNNGILYEANAKIAELRNERSQLEQSGAQALNGALHRAVQKIIPEIDAPSKMDAYVEKAAQEYGYTPQEAKAFLRSGNLAGWQLLRDAMAYRTTLKQAGKALSSAQAVAPEVITRQLPQQGGNTGQVIDFNRVTALENRFGQDYANRDFAEQFAAAQRGQR